MANLQALWDDLNERQRAELQALYECDQDTEAERRERAARGFYDRTPVSTWRWQIRKLEAAERFDALMGCGSTASVQPPTARVQH